MKLSPILISALFALSVGTAIADGADTTKPAPAATTAPAATPAATPAPIAAAPKKSTDIVYPYTFNCSHCGMKITVKNAAEWKKSCEMCACGSTNADCAPKKK